MNECGFNEWIAFFVVNKPYQELNKKQKERKREILILPTIIVWKAANELV